MDERPGFRFFAVPLHRVAPESTPAQDELVEPHLPSPEAMARALSGAQFRDMRARDKLRALLSPDQAPAMGSPGQGYGPAAIFARPPQDLPALLRMADQLDSLALSEAGERALVWRCTTCSARYAVPVALVRSVSIRCERCDATVELSPERSLGEESLMDPFKGTVNQTRRELAGFFREAMARGWPVLVCATDS